MGHSLQESIIVLEGEQIAPVPQDTAEPFDILGCLLDGSKCGDFYNEVFLPFFFNMYVVVILLLSVVYMLEIVDYELPRALGIKFRKAIPKLKTIHELH